MPGRQLAGRHQIRGPDGVGVAEVRRAGAAVETLAGPAAGRLTPRPVSGIRRARAPQWWPRRTLPRRWRPRPVLLRRSLWCGVPRWRREPRVWARSVLLADLALLARPGLHLRAQLLGRRAIPTGRRPARRRGWWRAGAAALLGGEGGGGTGHRRPGRHRDGGLLRVPGGRRRCGLGRGGASGRSAGAGTEQVIAAAARAVAVLRWRSGTYVRRRGHVPGRLGRRIGALPSHRRSAVRVPFRAELVVLRVGHVAILNTL